MDSLLTRYGRLDTKSLLIPAFYDSHGVFILFPRTGVLDPNPLSLLQHPTPKSEAMVTRPFSFDSIKIAWTGPRWLRSLAVYDPYVVVIHSTDNKTHQHLSNRCTTIMTVLQLRLLRLTTSSTDHDELHIRSPLFQLHHPNQHLYLFYTAPSCRKLASPILTAIKEQELSRAASMQGSSHFRFSEPLG